MQTYLQKIEEQLLRLPTDVAEQLDAIFTKKNWERGALLLQEGKYCRQLFWLQSGVARAFVLHEGKEVTTNFAFADDLIFSLQSALLEQPSHQSIQMLEAGTVAALDWVAFKKLARQYPALGEIDTMLSDYYAMELEERVLDLQTLTARQRYEKLLVHQPQMAAQIPLTHIASYLGISLETLSRIRGRR